jgi:fatty-acyl-CoA synthase
MWMHEHLLYWARENPDAEFALHDGRVLTYGDAADRMQRIASALVEVLDPGDRFAVVAKNSIDLVLLLLAASRAGGVAVPLNYRLVPSEWSYILEDSDARLVVAEAEFVDGLESIRGTLSRPVTTIAWTDRSVGEWVPFEEWIDSAPDRPVPWRRCEDAFQIYTSGTTGRPKGAVSTQGGLFAWLYQSRDTVPLSADDRLLIVAPIYHVAGLLYTLHAIACGAAAFIMADFVPEEVVRALDEEHIAAAILVPSMIQACLAVPDVEQRRFDALRLLGYGASSIAEATLRRAIRVFGCRFVQIFGMTEAPSLTHLTPADHDRALNGAEHLLLSVGRASPGTEIKIVDDGDDEVSPDTIGEICGRGPQLMRGYWKLPDATADALRDGWMHTGDAGCLDDEGYLYIKDRIKDMIVSGAENVYSREVENVLFEHPAVADAAVIGVPSEQWGEAVKAIVVRKPDSKLTGTELIEFCRGRLAGFKRPRSVDFVDQLPRNPSGKILKRVLREPYWQGAGTAAHDPQNVGTSTTTD